MLFLALAVLLPVATLGDIYVSVETVGPSVGEDSSFSSVFSSLINRLPFAEPQEEVDETAFITEPIELSSFFDDVLRSVFLHDNFGSFFRPEIFDENEDYAAFSVYEPTPLMVDQSSLSKTNLFDHMKELLSDLFESDMEDDMEDDDEESDSMPSDSMPSVDILIFPETDGEESEIFDDQSETYSSEETLAKIRPYFKMLDIMDEDEEVVVEDGPMQIEDPSAPTVPTGLHACHNEALEFCQLETEQMSVLGVLSCLKENLDSMGNPCYAEVEDSPLFNCEKDIKLFCPSANEEKEISTCLKEHDDVLSEACAAGMEARIPHLVQPHLGFDATIRARAQAYMAQAKVEKAADSEDAISPIAIGVCGVLLLGAFVGSIVWLRNRKKSASTDSIIPALHPASLLGDFDADAGSVVEVTTAAL